MYTQGLSLFSSYKADHQLMLILCYVADQSSVGWKRIYLSRRSYREELEREVYSVNLKTSRIERVHLETKYYSPFDIWRLLNGHLYQIC